ncbi:MAG: carbohydrate ABC transporter permease [Christensenellaceae bacterium]|nr:carbohydrate ABC transporter permease [Christensenellaceae bacterium]
MKLKTRGDRTYQVVINSLAVLIGLITLYPLIYTLSASLSQPIHILSGNVVLWPVEMTLNSYRRVFASADILNGYRNTIIYSFSGTLLNVILTIMAAYPLSLPDLKGKNFVTFLITFTMFFSGGMIPSFINVKNLGLMNSPLAIILPGAINATNMLLLRNYFINSVPGDLREAASIDGCSPFATMTQIILPLSKSILAVITLYYFVGHWNSYFEAMMYIRNKDLYPLQVLLRQILLLSQMGDMSEQMGVDDMNTMLIYASLKYAIIVVSAVPLLIIYPMVQRFFEKGIMMGSIKG